MRCTDRRTYLVGFQPHGQTRRETRRTMTKILRACVEMLYKTRERERAVMNQLIYDDTHFSIKKLDRTRASAAIYTFLVFISCCYRFIIVIFICFFFIFKKITLNSLNVFLLIDLLNVEIFLDHMGVLKRVLTILQW
uniref:Uncharacterized protein n=1 Tax=Trichogramma kaykai TaxID=54128 RepID=A0ABD2WW91_9HYME